MYELFTRTRILGIQALTNNTYKNLRQFFQLMGVCYLE